MLRSDFVQISRMGLLLIMVFFTQCKTPSTIVEGDQRNVSEGCYASMENGDEISMSLSVNETKVSGSLYFAVKDKEQSVGTYSGVMKGDMMYIQYRFASQNSEGVRDMIFEKKAKTVSEKTIQLEDGKETKYLSTGVVLKSIECARDEKGCMANFGYTWSEEDKKCIDRSQRSQKIRDASSSKKL